jgi:hypothetical protein
MPNATTITWEQLGKLMEVSLPDGQSDEVQDETVMREYRALFSTEYSEFFAHMRGVAEYVILDGLPDNDPVGQVAAMFLTMILAGAKAQQQVTAPWFTNTAEIRVTSIEFDGEDKRVLVFVKPMGYGDAIEMYLREGDVLQIPPPVLT